VDVYWSKSLNEIHPNFENIIKDDELLVQYLTDLGVFDEQLFVDLDNLRWY
jgi:hypothetical protein